MITIGGIEFDLKLSLLIILSTILPMLDYYDNRLTGSVLVDRVLLYLVAPLLVIVLVLRESPAGYGFRLGNWRVGLLYTVAGCAGMALILWFVARTPAMQNYYAKRTPAELPALLATTGVYFLSGNSCGVASCSLGWPPSWGLARPSCCRQCLCLHAPEQAGTGNAEHDFWRHCLWLCGLAVRLLLLPLSDSLVYCGFHDAHCQRPAGLSRRDPSGSAI